MELITKELSPSSLSPPDSVRPPTPQLVYRERIFNNSLGRIILPRSNLPANFNFRSTHHLLLAYPPFHPPFAPATYTHAHHVRPNPRDGRCAQGILQRWNTIYQQMHKTYVPSLCHENPSSLTQPPSLLADRREFMKISQAVGMGFLIMGAIGYFIKLSEIHPSTRTVSRGRLLLISSRTVHIPINNVLVG